MDGETSAFACAVQGFKNIDSGGKTPGCCDDRFAQRGEQVQLFKNLDLLYFFCLISLSQMFLNMVHSKKF